MLLQHIVQCRFCGREKSSDPSTEMLNRIADSLIVRGHEQMLEKRERLAHKPIGSSALSPSMARGFPGKRVEAYLAGIIPRNSVTFLFQK